MLYLTFFLSSVVYWILLCSLLQTDFPFLCLRFGPSKQNSEWQPILSAQRQVVPGSNDLLHPKTFIIFIRYWSSLYADPREFLLQFSLNLAKSIVPVKDKDSSHALRAGQDLHIFLTFYQCLPVSSFWFWESSSSCKSTQKKKKIRWVTWFSTLGKELKIASPGLSVLKIVHGTPSVNYFQCLPYFQQHVAVC